MINFFLPSKISYNDSERLTKNIIVKNYVLVCVSMFFFMMAVNTMGGLQSTINKDGGLGVVSSCVVFGVYALTALLVPELFTHLIGFKWTYTISFVLQLFYIGLNAYPKWYTYIPASVLGGLGQCLSFTCSSDLVLKLATLYSETTRQDLDGVEATFFGFYGIAIQAANVFGSLIIGLIFQQPRQQSRSSNLTIYFDYSVCGKHFCPNSLLPPSAAPPIEKIYILVGVLEVCVLLAILSSGMINNFTESHIEKPCVRHILKEEIQELKKQIFQLKQLLAIPINLLTGFYLTFLWVDFTRSFAACSVGIDYIGWASLVLYSAATLFSPIFGKLESKFTLVPIFLFYWALMIATFVWMLFWESTPDTQYKLFVLALLLGIIESVNTPMPRTLYANIFHTEAIYSSYSFFMAIGLLFGFLITVFCCTFIKIYIILALCGLCVGCGIGLYVIERRIKEKKEKTVTSIQLNDLD